MDAIAKWKDVHVGDDMAKLIIRLKGSASSGHYGHAGRPGKVGGSAPAKLRVGKKPSTELQRTSMGILADQLGKVAASSQELSTKVQVGSGKIAEKLRPEVEANFPEGDRLGYALGATGDAYIGNVATTRDKSGKLVGIATYLKGEVPEGHSIPAGKYFSITYMATVRGGIGRPMMNALKAQARKEGYGLNAEADNPGSGAFLKKVGFKESDIYGSGGAFYYWKP